MFAPAEALDGGLAGGVNGEMKAADAFDGEDLAGCEEIDGSLDGIGRIVRGVSLGG
jgi:hypothetical protein